MAGVLDSEQPLSERKPAYSLTVGCMPVREAIKPTTGEGLVEGRPARGTYIRQIMRADVLEICEVRDGAEGIAAYLAAERGVTDEFSHYRLTFLDMVERPDGLGLAQIHRFEHASVRGHLEILDALEKREPARARQVTCDHLATGLAVRSRIIEQFEYKSNSAKAAS
jgi:DNA-binding GntR family transcriptional regulator